MEREAPHDGHLVSVVSVIDSSITTHTQLFLVSSNLERATHAVHQPAVQVDTGQSVSIFMLQFHLFSMPLYICFMIDKYSSWRSGAPGPRHGRVAPV